MGGWGALDESDRYRPEASRRRLDRCNQVLGRSGVAQGPKVSSAPVNADRGGQCRILEPGPGAENDRGGAGAQPRGELAPHILLPRDHLGVAIRVRFPEALVMAAPLVEAIEKDGIDIREAP